MSAPTQLKRITVPEIRAHKGGKPVVMLTCYHAHTARLSIGNIGPVNRGLAASRDRVVFNMAEMTGNIWMTEFRSR